MNAYTVQFNGVNKSITIQADSFREVERICKEQYPTFTLREIRLISAIDQSNLF